MPPIRYSNQQFVTKKLLAVNSGDLAADGSAKEFDFVGISNYNQVKTFEVTQLTPGSPAKANWTFEIWAVDDSGYNPALSADLYNRKFARDVDEPEYMETIEWGLDYEDDDDTKEIHGRIVNQVGGTASDFDVIIQTLVW